RADRRRRRGRSAAERAWRSDRCRNRSRRNRTRCQPRRKQISEEGSAPWLPKTRHTDGRRELRQEAAERLSSATMRAAAVAGVFLLTLLAAPFVRAGNDDELFVGNRAAMSGGAVSATVADSSATWYNPAGLGAIDRAQIDVSGTAYTVRFYTAPKFLSATSGESKDGSVSEFVSIPTQIAYVRRLAPGVSLGLGYFVPHASNWVLREQLEVGSAANGSQWQVAGTVSDVQHTAAAAVG